MRNRALAAFVILSGATMAVPPASCAQSIELTRAGSLGYVSYTWRGEDNSGEMRLTINNRTEREWIIHVEVGTKLEPANASAQSMTVTREVHVTVHPHERHVIDVRVACLDISKDAPAVGDVVWAATVVPPLRDFISCTNRIIDDEARSAPQDARRSLRAMRPFIVQASLWRARGATMQQWINFFETYQHLSGDQAREMAAGADEAAGSVVQQCPGF